MDAISPGALHRTVKLEMDDGRAATFAEAEEIAKRYVLGIDAGAAVARSETHQAALLTAVNAGARAFPGGVLVRLAEDAPAISPWGEGELLSAAGGRFGGVIAERLRPGAPALLIGADAAAPETDIALYATWQGWAGGVIDDPRNRLPETEGFPLAGALAGALGVSEAFQHARGHAPAGRRPAGLSLWRPEIDWRAEDARGRRCDYLPDRLWLVGLGHLGQAYSWMLGLLPYERPADVSLVLQDYDRVEEANRSTGMLSAAAAAGRKKTRVVAERLERLGFGTAVTERAFDGSTRRADSEPGVALAGLDSPAPRRLLEAAGFGLAVDAGLGGQARNYLDILVHAFPSGIEAADAWPAAPAPPPPPAERPAYRDLARQLAETTDLTDGEIECGVIDLAGRSAGAAFVGCAAAALVVSEVLRALAGGPRYQVLGWSLRSPQAVQAAANERAAAAPPNPGFVRARAAS